MPRCAPQDNLGDSGETDMSEDRGTCIPNLSGCRSTEEFGKEKSVDMT